MFTCYTYCIAGLVYSFVFIVLMKELEYRNRFFWIICGTFINVKISCILFPKSVSNNDDTIICELCQTSIRIKFNDLNYIDYKYLPGCNESWYRLSCTNKLFSFGNLNNQTKKNEPVFCFWNDFHIYLKWINFCEN